MVKYFYILIQRCLSKKKTINTTIFLIQNCRKIAHLGNSFLVVTDAGVKGRYFNLDDAKNLLKGITSGARLIAEVDKSNKVLKDPHLIEGQPQTRENGFNKSWGNWYVINRLIEICEKFIQNMKGMFRVSQ